MNSRTIIYLIGAVLFGLLAGYFLFGGNADVPADHNHNHEVSTDENGEAIWTCSMHPQIQQEGPGDCPLCGMDLIPLETGNETDPAILTMTEAAVALAQVQTITIGEGGANAGAADAAGQNTLTLTGRLAPDERTAAVEVAEFSGRIERLFVSFSGEQVRAGQRIATVYSPDLVVAQEALLQARKFADINPELVVAARSKLRNLKVTEEQISALEQTGEVVQNFPVYADRSGTILETKAEVGEYIPAGGALYTYTNLEKLWALFDAYEVDLAQINIGDEVSFKVASRPGQTYMARVSFIDPSINPNTRTAAVRAEVSNRQGVLKPEMFIEGIVRVNSRPAIATEANVPEAFVVPKSAVLWTGARSVVYVELPDTQVPTYTFREVAIGESTAGGYLITSGLTAGDQVVVNGAFQLDAAAQLSNKASMMNRDVLIAGRAPDAIAPTPIPDYRKGTPTAFKEQLGGVVEAYLPLKDQLVATQTASTEMVAGITEALAVVEMGLLKGEAHAYWMQELAALTAHLKLLDAGEEVEKQREQFGYLSQALINALTAFGVDGSYYVQHCPMAFDNTGANWLSDEEQIRNPYFGDLMMKCGMVTDEL